MSGATPGPLSRRSMRSDPVRRAPRRGARARAALAPERVDGVGDEVVQHRLELQAVAGERGRSAVARSTSDRHAWRSRALRGRLGDASSRRSADACAAQRAGAHELAQPPHHRRRALASAPPGASSRRQLAVAIAALEHELARARVGARSRTAAGSARARAWRRARSPRRRAGCGRARTACRAACVRPRSRSSTAAAEEQAGEGERPASGTGSPAPRRRDGPRIAARTMTPIWIDDVATRGAREAAPHRDPDQRQEQQVEELELLRRAPSRTRPRARRGSRAPAARLPTTCRAARRRVALA